MSSPQVPRLLKLREEETHLEEVMAGLKGGNTNLRSIAAYNEHAKELLQVRHAITDLKPTKEKIEKLAGALTRMNAKREALQSDIDATLVGLDEANNNFIKSEEEYAFPSRNLHFPPV